MVNSGADAGQTSDTWWWRCVNSNRVYLEAEPKLPISSRLLTFLSHWGLTDGSIEGFLCLFSVYPSKSLLYIWRKSSLLRASHRLADLTPRTVCLCSLDTMNTSNGHPTHTFAWHVDLWRMKKIELEREDGHGNSLLPSITFHPPLSFLWDSNTSAETVKDSPIIY